MYAHPNIDTCEHMPVNDALVFQGALVLLLGWGIFVWAVTTDLYLFCVLVCCLKHDSYKEICYEEPHCFHSLFERMYP